MRGRWGLPRPPVTKGQRNCVRVPALLAVALFSTSHPAWSAPQGGAPREAGSLEGIVRLAGQRVPQPTVVANTTDPDICGRDQTLEDLLVDREGRGVQNVIVSLANVPAAAVPPTAPQRLVLDNRECRFVPHVAAVTVASTLVATNSDSILHNTHLYGPVRSNIALPFEGMTVTRTLDRPGMIAVKCDVHGWMEAYVRVDSHPFHAVTDERGRFRIEGIPPGEYRVDLWHERLGQQERTVRITSGETTVLVFTYAAEGG